MSYKYIVMEKGNLELPIIFPKGLVHSHVASAVTAMMAMEALQMMPEHMRSDRVRADFPCRHPTCVRG